MKRSRRWIVLFALVMLALSAAAVHAADEKEMALARRKAMLEAGRAAFCRVQYFFQRPEDEKRGGYDTFDFERFTQFQYDSYIENHVSLLTVGLLLDEAGHVLVGDMHFEDKYIERIEVVAPDGTRYPAARDKLLDRSPAVILKITEPLKDWKAPAFVRQERIEEPGSVFAASLARTGRRWWISIAPLGTAYDYGGSGPAPDRFGGGVNMSVLGAMMPGPAYNPFALFGMGMSDITAASGRPALLCNKEGRPIGAVVPGWPLEPDQKTADWQHERLLNGPALSFAELAETVERCRAEFGKNVYKCRLLYRQKGGEERGMDFEFLMERAMGGRDGKEWTTFGLAISPTRLLVPHSIGRAQAAKIEKIEITSGAQTLEGEFVGAFQEIGAFLVDLKDGALPAHATLTVRDRPERMRPFLTVAASEKFGKKHLQVRPNRWLTEERGYRDRYYVSPLHSVPQGTVVLDRSFGVLGLYARQRIEGEEIRGLSEGPMSSMMFGGLPGGMARIFWTDELASTLQDPVAHFDPQILHKTEDEAKRTVWLGVEFASLTRELAKQLDVEKQTKDGTVGLYVNRVYKDSPAERLGVKEGDILLRIETPKLPEPIELSAGAGGGFYSFDWTDYMDFESMEEYAGTKPRWPMRHNYVTMLLKSIGEGEKVKLTYLHGGEEVSKEFAVEQAPRDFTSAKKYKNREVGLTVKDLTYEVRVGLRLGEDKEAVVVAKIEPGSPAEVAKIAPLELITAVDGTPVASAEEFGKRIKEALAEGRKTLRVTVERLGKTRLADLDLSQVKEEDEAEE